MSTKEIQGKLWNTAPRHWARHFEPWFLPMYKKVLTKLKLDEEDALLDAGCGSGLFSSLTIETGAHVTGIDAAPGLLEIARERNPMNEFLEEDLEAMPFIDNTFDVVAGFNAFQYAGSFEKALLEAKRVLIPRGRMVVGMWDKPEQCDASHIFTAISKLLPTSPYLTPGPFALSDDGVMECLFEKASLKIIYKTIVACPFLYASLGDGIKAFMSTGPAAAAQISNKTSVVESVVGRALNEFRVIDDFYYLQNHLVVFILEK